jgi:hypothetical protein
MLGCVVSGRQVVGASICVDLFVGWTVVVENEIPFEARIFLSCLRRTLALHARDFVPGSVSGFLVALWTARSVPLGGPVGGWGMLRLVWVNIYIYIVHVPNWWESGNMVTASRDRMLIDRCFT